jgi:hypothetical protein
MAHNILANPDYKDEIDYVPFREYDTSDSTRRWKDFMSGDWAWQQAVRLSYLYGIALDIAHISSRTPYRKIQKHMDLP